MPTIKHILFPVDFSKRCEGAAPFVGNMARQFGAAVTLFTAMPPVWQAAMADPTATILIDMEELKRDLQARLDGYLLPQFAGITVRRIAQVGDPASAITEFAH